jgi:acyl-coenzyme A synthetase/AMP-(fatty) acid ligase
MRDFLIPYIQNHAQLHPLKDAFIVPNQGSLTYSQLFEAAIYWDNILKKFNFPIPTRIGILDVDILTLAGLGTAIVSRHTFVGIDHNIGKDAILDYINLMHIDVIITQFKSNHQSILEASNVTWLNVVDHSLVILKEMKVQPFTSSNDTVGMIKTSGTTSIPKVIPVSEAMLVSQFDMYVDQFEVKDFDVFAQPVNMSRPISFLLQTIRCWRWGNTLVYTALDSSKETFKHINEFEITRFTAPTFMIHALNEYAANHEIVLNHNLVIVNLGSTLQPMHVNFLRNHPTIKIVNSYGMSETGLLSSTYRQTHEDIFSAGVDLGVKIKLIDDEICIGFPNYFQGYENFNENVFVDGYFRTGDSGVFDEFGNLHIVGRVKEMINRGGDKISPYEIENHILELFNVQDIAVFPIPSHQWSQEVGCAIVCDQTITLPQMREALKSKVSSFKMPVALYAMPSIPRSANGKINRNFLHQVCTQEYLVHTVSEKQPMSESQSIIHECWCEVLQCSSIGLDCDFISYGGDSFRFAQLWTLIQEKTQRFFDISNLLEANTIRKQAQKLQELAQLNESIIVLLKEGDKSKTPIVFVHDVAGTCEAYANLLKYDFDNHPVYGINLNVSIINEHHLNSLKSLVQIYAKEFKNSEIKSMFIGGISSGGLIAYECAQALEGLVDIKGVFMIDTFIHLNEKFKTKWGRLRSLIRKHWRNIKTSSPTLTLKILPQLFMKALKRGYTINVVDDQLSKDVAEYLIKPRELQKSHRQQLIRKLIEGWTPSKLNIDVLYYYANNKHNPHHSYTLIKEAVKSLNLFEIDTHHSGFVSESLALITVNELKSFIQEKEV